MGKVSFSEFSLYGDPALYKCFEFYNYLHALEILATSYPNALAPFTFMPASIFALNVDIT